MRDKLVRDLRRLNLSVNVTQFTAQRYEQECVTLVRDMAFSLEVQPDLRLKCAAQVVAWARGAVQEWPHDRGTIDPDERTPFGETVGETIDAIKVETAVFEELDSLVRRNVPYSEWPERIKALPESAMFADSDSDR